ATEVKRELEVFSSSLAFHQDVRSKLTRYIDYVIANSDYPPDLSGEELTRPWKFTLRQVAEALRKRCRVEQAWEPDQHLSDGLRQAPKERGVVDTYLYCEPPEGLPEEKPECFKPRIPRVLGRIMKSVDERVMDGGFFGRLTLENWEVLDQVC